MNVFLTGPRQIGKSTAVRRYLAGCGLHYGGFFTVWGPDDRLHLLRAADPGAKMTAATAVARRASSRVQAEAAAFDHLGCQALEAPAQLLVLDEVKMLKDRGLRIDAVGMQGHMGMDYPSVSEFEASILAFAATPGKQDSYRYCGG